MDGELFEVTLTLNSSALKLSGEFVEESKGMLVYLLIPSETNGISNGKVLQGPEETKRVKALKNGLCEVCGTDASGYFFANGHLTARCAEHVEGISFEGTIKLPKPQIIDELLARSTEGEFNERKKVHMLAETLHGKGLTVNQISEELIRQGYNQVRPRTLGKHLRGECSCLVDERSA
jgi:hypothetical protein